MPPFTEVGLSASVYGYRTLTLANDYQLEDPTGAIESEDFMTRSIVQLFLTILFVSMAGCTPTSRYRQGTATQFYRHANERLEFSGYIDTTWSEAFGVTMIHRLNILVNGVPLLQETLEPIEGEKRFLTKHNEIPIEAVCNIVPFPDPGQARSDIRCTMLIEREETVTLVFNEGTKSIEKCEATADCASGEVCLGEAGCDAVWTCQPAIPCSRDMVDFCGCDGESFQGSSGCPPKKYAGAGACK